MNAECQICRFFEDMIGRAHYLCERTLLRYLTQPWNGISAAEDRSSGGFKPVSKAPSATNPFPPMDETNCRRRQSSQASARMIYYISLLAQSILASQDFFRRTRIRLVSHLGQYVPTSKKRVAFGGEPPIFTRVG